MKYIGLQTQIWRNNLRSTLLLLLFPLVFFLLTWLFIFFAFKPEIDPVNETNVIFLRTIPWVTIIVLFWFLIAFFSHTSIIKNATGSLPLERKKNKRVYNLVENLCISVGMKVPKIYIIEDDSLNAFASGINTNTYSISLSEGIINKLNDEELQGVIAHELTHIRNRDVRLLIVSIIFVGIFAFLSEMIFRSFIYGRSGRNKKDGRLMIIALLLAIIGYLLSIVFRFALSRKREYLADAGAAELTKDPLALASALKRVSKDSRIEAVERKDVAQLFIENPQEKKKSSGLSFSSIFATHPPIEKRIKILEQF